MKMCAVPNLLTDWTFSFISNGNAKTSRFLDKRRDLRVCLIEGSDINRKSAKMLRTDIVPSAVHRSNVKAFALGESF